MPACRRSYSKSDSVPARPPDATTERPLACHLLAAQVADSPDNRDLSQLIGELATRSEPFRMRWAAHDVRLHRTGVKHFHHPVLGDLDLTLDALDLPAGPGLTRTAEPGTTSHDTLTVLASWAATEHRDEPQARRTSPLNHRPSGTDGALDLACCISRHLARRELVMQPVLEPVPTTRNHPRAAGSLRTSRSTAVDDGHRGARGFENARLAAD